MFDDLKKFALQIFTTPHHQITVLLSIVTGIVAWLILDISDLGGIDHIFYSLLAMIAAAIVSDLHYRIRTKPNRTRWRR